MEKTFKEKVKTANLDTILKNASSKEEWKDYEEIWMDKVDQIIYNEERERQKKKVR